MSVSQLLIFKTWLSCSLPTFLKHRDLESQKLKFHLAKSKRFEVLTPLSTHGLLLDSAMNGKRELERNLINSILLNHSEKGLREMLDPNLERSRSWSHLILKADWALAGCKVLLSLQRSFSLQLSVSVSLSHTHTHCEDFLSDISAFCFLLSGFYSQAFASFSHSRMKCQLFRACHICISGHLRHASFHLYKHLIFFFTLSSSKSR